MGIKHKKQIDFIVKDIVSKTTKVERRDGTFYIKTPYGLLAYDYIDSTMGFWCHWEPAICAKYKYDLTIRFGCSEYDMDIVWMEYSLYLIENIESIPINN